MAELVLRNIRKTYSSARGRTTVLDGIDLSIHSGEMIVLLGPSGCGKTTLLKIVAGLVRPDDGDFALTIGGHPIREPGPDRNIVFQTHTAYPWLTVLENVRFGVRFMGLPEEEQTRRALENLRIVELYEYRNEYPRVLSGGQRQRLAIARTLAADPKLILMDEPFAALDVRTRQIMQDYLLELWKKTRPTILFVTHDITEAAYLGKRVFVLTRTPARLANPDGFDTEEEIEKKIVARAERDPLVRADLERRDPGCPLSEIGIRRRGDWVRYHPEFGTFSRALRDAVTDSAEGDIKCNAPGRRIADDTAAHSDSG